MHKKKVTINLHDIPIDSVLKGIHRALGDTPT